MVASTFKVIYLLYSHNLKLKAKQERVKVLHYFNFPRLMNWLSKWYVNHDGNKKPQRPNPWAKNDDGSFYKAALLSGPLE